MNMRHSLLPTLCCLFIIFSPQIHAQDGVERLTEHVQSATIDSISNRLLSTYIFPEVAKEMSDVLQTKVQKGKYQSLENPFDFATQLTEDLQSISNDKHIRVEYHPPRPDTPARKSTEEDSLNDHKRFLHRLQRENFGFKELKILEGNIGYLDLRNFTDPEFGGPTAVSAMNFLSNSDAIIIDLRQNTGGSPAMIQLISSYLFPSRPIHLNTFYWRPADQHTQTWTLPHVEGKRSSHTPVYILTSSRTFSAAEEFSYNLKHLQRATLIGETTGGGAHPGGPVPATGTFIVWIPSGRAINPITNTNWEGTGVKPHVEVPSAQALEVAHLKALEALIEENEDPSIERYYHWHLSSLQAKVEPVNMDASLLRSYVGAYGPRTIRRVGETLWYQRGEDRKYELFPLSKTEFELAGLPAWRVRFLSKNGKVVALEMYSDSGYSNQNSKTEE